MTRQAAESVQPRSNENTPMIDTNLLYTAGKGALVTSANCGERISQLKKARQGKAQKKWRSRRSYIHTKY